MVEGFRGPDPLYRGESPSQEPSHLEGHRSHHLLGDGGFLDTERSRLLRGRKIPDYKVISVEPGAYYKHPSPRTPSLEL